MLPIGKVVFKISTGFVSACTFEVTVTDIEAPTATISPATVDVQCLGDIPEPNTEDIADEADNCGVPIIAYVSDISDGKTNP